MLGENMKDKTIILSSLIGSSEKAVLNLEKAEDGFLGKIRLYNFKSIPKGILTLGFLIDKQVYKSALTFDGRDSFTFNLDVEKLPSFTCALINIVGGNATPLLSGSSDNKIENETTIALCKNFSLLDKTDLSVDEVENSLNKSGIDYIETEKQDIEEAIDKSLCEECQSDKCANCNYRNAFYNRPPTNVTKQPLYPENDTKESNLDFYNEIKGQLSILFERYPEETFLNEIIPNSKWVKVDYEDNGKYFVIGLIYEDEKVSYVCYGMPGEYTFDPPKEFSGISQWLPLDPEKPNELGYWLMYQDAETGENVEIKIS